MKILHAITRLDKGGSAVNTLLSVIGLAELGYDVDLLFGSTKDADNILMEKARTSRVRLIEERSLLRDIHPFKDIECFFRVLNFTRKNRYDIVHTHSSKAGLICRLAARCAGVKKVIYTPHGHVFYGYFNKFKTRIIIFVEAVMSHFTDKIIGLTPAECDEWLGFGIGKKEQYRDIPSGVDFKQLEEEASEGPEWREKIGIHPEKAIVGSVGRFVDVKGHNYFIEAAAELLRVRKDIYFILAGNGELREEYAGKIKELGLDDNFQIIPWQENTGALIKAFDVFVMPSLNEGMGRVLIEAMFLGKPVVATAVGGVPSVIAGGAGILVEPASSGAISSAVKDLINDPHRAKDVGDIAHEKVSVKYSKDEMVKKLDELYQAL